MKAESGQEHKAVWIESEAQLDEGEGEKEDCHVTRAPNIHSSKYSRRSLEHLRTKVARQLFNLERILAAKKSYSTASLISIFRHDGSYVALPYPPPLSVLRLDQEVRHTIDVLDKQRKLEIGRLQGCASSARSRDTASPSTPCLSISSIYRKLYHGFLARRILKRTPTIFNRRTVITIRECSIIEEHYPDDEWISETRVERLQRNLRVSGIEMTHTVRKWNDNQRQHVCFQPSLLRWSWTTIGKVESEAFPNWEQ